MQNISFFLTIGALAGSATALAQPTPSPADSPPVPSAQAPSETVRMMDQVQPGDHWTYQSRDEITGEVKETFTQIVTDVTATEVNLRINTAGQPNKGNVIFDYSWNVKIRGAWTYTPHDGTGVRLPLTVGKAWTFQSNAVNSTSGVSFKRSGSSKVVGQERITTKAGTFDTFKIETSFTARNTNDPTKKFQDADQMWYAPAINHWVKRIFTERFEGHLRENNSIELTEYGRKE